MLREYIEEKSKPLLLKEYKEEQQMEQAFEDKKDGKITFAEHVKNQMVVLTKYDHELFKQIVDGLVSMGWHEDGGSPTYRLLSKDEAAIKIFRNEEAPKVIKICFSAEPEEEVHDHKCEICGKKWSPRHFWFCKGRVAEQENK